MFGANSARTASKEAAKQEVEKIEKLIKDATSSRRTSIQITDMSDGAQRTLLDHGYEIVFKQFLYTHYYIISW